MIASKAASLNETLKMKDAHNVAIQKCPKV